MNKLLEDAVTAAIALRFELLEDLPGGVSMTFQQRDELALESIELAGASGTRTPLVTGPPCPFGNGFWIQFKFCGNLGRREVVFIQEQPELTESGVIDQAHKAFMAAGVALPPTLREKA